MEEYKIRMIEEYAELKERYNKLHRMIIKYEAGTLDFKPNCHIGLLKDQCATMGEYLRVLEIRSEIEGIGYDELQKGFPRTSECAIGKYASAHN